MHSFWIDGVCISVAVFSHRQHFRAHYYHYSEMQKLQVAQNPGREILVFLEFLEILEEDIVLHNNQRCLLASTEERHDRLYLKHNRP